MTQEALKLAEIIEHFDSNDESLPLELLKEIAATLRALAQTEQRFDEFGLPKPRHYPPMPKVAQTQEPVGVVHHKLTSTLGADYEQVAVFVRPVEPGTKLYTTQPQRTEQNFCSRCGKRTADLTVIHTCTPPQENT